MKPGQVHVWIINPSDVVRNDSDAVLSKVELERALKMEDRGARQLFVAGRIVMRTILGMILNLDRGQIDIQINDGKPVCVNQGAPHISLAKRPDCLVFAVSLQPIGVDVEPLVESVENKSVVENFFSPTERQHLDFAKPDEPDWTRKFLQIWTQKEAYSKAIGTGATADFSLIVTSPGGGAIADKHNDEQENSYFGHLVPNTGNIVVAMATTISSPEIFVVRNLDEQNKIT